jgi:hypothetical protein
MTIITSEDILIVNQTVTINGANTSISSTTGALVITNGGFAIGENINVENNFTCESNINLLNTLTIGFGSTSYFLPTVGGLSNDVLVFSTSNGLVFESIDLPNKVTSVSFGIADKLMMSSGILKDMESSSITIDINNNVSNIRTIDVLNNTIFNGVVNIKSTFPSTNNTSGALIVSGGVGISENLNSNNLIVDGNTNIFGILQIGTDIANYTFPNSTGELNQLLVLNTDGALIFETETINVNQVNAPSLFTSDNVILKTVGTGEDIESTSIILSDLNDLSNINSVGINNNVTFGGVLNISATFSSLNNTTGSLLVSGGVAINKNLNIGNNINVNNMNITNILNVGNVSEYKFPSDIGSNNQILILSTDGGLLFQTPTNNPNQIESSSFFGTDNVLIKTDGITRNVKSTSILVSDLNDIYNINTLNVMNESTINGTLYIISGESSVSNTTGALIISGGIGLSDNINIGGDLTSDGLFFINNTTVSISTNTGSIVIDGGVGISGDLFISGTLFTDGIILNSVDDFIISSTKISSNNTTGALVVNGDIGVSGDFNIGGNSIIDNNLSVNDIFIVNNTTNSISTDSGALIFSGGVGIEKNINVGGLVNISDVSQSIYTDNGSLVIGGGVGIAKNLNIGNDFNILGSVRVTNLTNTSGVGTGALIIDGGTSISKNLTVSGGLQLNEPLINNSKFFMAVHTITTSVSSTTSSQLQWNTEIRKDTGLFFHPVNSPNIDVLETGWYEIIVEITTQIESGDGGDRTIGTNRITVNNVLITGSTSFMYNRTANQGYNTTNLVIIQNLTENDRLNVDINRIGGSSTITSVNNACRIFISRI